MNAKNKLFFNTNVMTLLRRPIFNNIISDFINESQSVDGKIALPTNDAPFKINTSKRILEYLAWSIKSTFTASVGKRDVIVDALLARRIRSNYSGVPLLFNADEPQLLTNINLVDVYVLKFDNPTMSTSINLDSVSHIVFLHDGYWYLAAYDAVEFTGIVYTNDKLPTGKMPIAESPLESVDDAKRKLKQWAVNKGYANAYVSQFVLAKDVSVTAFISNSMQASFAPDDNEFSSAPSDINLLAGSVIPYAYNADTNELVFLNVLRWCIVKDVNSLLRMTVSEQHVFVDLANNIKQSAIINTDLDVDTMYASIDRFINVLRLTTLEADVTINEAGYTYVPVYSLVFSSLKFDISDGNMQKVFGTENITLYKDSVLYYLRNSLNGTVFVQLPNQRNTVWLIAESDFDSYFFSNFVYHKA